jgi:hypothetical protein
MGVGGQHQAPADLPPGKSRYPFYRRLGGPQGRSGRVRHILAPLGFDPRTVQLVESRFANWTNPASDFFYPYSIFIPNFFCMIGA